MRFSIRDVLWLTVVVAVGLGWLVHARSLHSSLREWQSAYGQVHEEAFREVRGMWHALAKMGPTDSQKDQFIKDKDWYVEGERRAYEELGPPH